MGASIDTGGGDKRSVDVAINIVPFIDVMSCLTAFLLFAATWLQIARIDVAPRGKTDHPIVNPPDVPQLAVLVADDTIYVGATRLSGDDVTRRIDRKDADAWEQLRRHLSELKREYFADQTEIQIAADSRPDHVVSYQDLVAAMDDAIKAGFPDVGLTDPNGLPWHPTL